MQGPLPTKERQSFPVHIRKLRLAEVAETSQFDPKRNFAVAYDGMPDNALEPKVRDTPSVGTKVVKAFKSVEVFQEDGPHCFRIREP